MAEDNPFAVFDAPSTAPPANPFAAFDAAPTAMTGQPFSKADQPWWYPVASGALPFGIAPRVEAGAAAAKESLSGGLPFSQAYSQALTQYQQAGKEQKEAHPIASAVGETAGSLAPLMLGGEAINAGLEGLGSTGRFLAGEADIPAIARTAAGRFRALTPIESALNYGTDFASKLALYAREGAQAGTFGALQQGTDPLVGAGRGALFGTAAGATVPAATWALGKLADVPSAVGGMLPNWAKMVLGAAGAIGGAEHAGQIASLAAEHPIAAIGAAGVGGTIAASKFLTDHPELRDLLTRLGVLAYGPATGGSSSVAPGLLSTNR